MPTFLWRIPGSRSLCHRHHRRRLAISLWSCFPALELIETTREMYAPVLLWDHTQYAADDWRINQLPGRFDGSVKCYLEPSCCTIANDFSTCASGERPSSFEESVAMTLWSLLMTKVTRSIKPRSIA